MNSLRRKTATKAMPSNFELFEKKNEQFARWKARNGKTRTAKTTTGRDGSLRIVVQCGNWLGKYRNAAGAVIEASTGCRDRVAAQAVLSEWIRREELI
ncbi:MAG: hypothetical protein ACKVHE_17210 [Planctomycetales bacterium]|jgi:hypothetical protein